MGRLSTDTAPALDLRGDRLSRSVAQSQLFTSAGVLLIAGIALVVSPGVFQVPAFLIGLALVFGLTFLALAVRWSRSRWVVILPILDIVAIVAIRDGSPELQAGVFLVFPIIWMARNFGLVGAISSVALSTALLWMSTVMPDGVVPLSALPALVLLPLALAFIATTTFVTMRRTNGQRSLLREQAAIIEAAFQRTRSQERLLDEVLNAVEFQVLAFDRAGTVTLTNNALRHSLSEFGVTDSYRHPVVYQADRTTPHPESTRPIARALAGQEFDNITIWVGEPGSRRAAFSVTARRLVTDAGEPDGCVLVLRDITRELMAITAQDDLVASVSHELRTPLTSSLGYLELVLEDTTLAPATRGMVQTALRNSERLLEIVSDVLLAASNADSQLPIRIVRCDLAPIVTEAVNALQDSAHRRNLTMTSDLPVHAVTMADPLRIRQVMDNLISNAIKYNSEDGSIRVELRLHGPDIEVSVRDTGAGLSASDASMLFERYYRTESAKRSSVHGAGLGLSITREIMLRHGGDLRVTSEPGVGSDFTLTLPSLGLSVAAPLVAHGRS
ncbi:MAG: PAS domain-containing sensor histidine kinase [Burkholderiaceae bacterium]|nr:PAS domain-containing sensor histidine kinase [Microbacteriaceae bacterium]